MYKDGMNISIAVDEKIAECIEEVTAWNRHVFGLGIAGYYTDLNSAGSTDGVAAWASAALPVGDFGQFAVSARIYDDLLRERSQDGKNIDEIVDGWSAGARYTHLLSKRALKTGSDRGKFTRAFVEVGYTEEEFSGITDDFVQAGIGAEMQLSKDLFLQFVVGRTFDSIVDRSDYISAQFKWSLSSATVN